MSNITADAKQATMESFHAHLLSSRRIVALLGAGLSASSGLPTFRGPGGYWRKHDATMLATPGAFEADPGLVWQFYNYRRHMALNAQPNPAHYALAELAKRRPQFMTLSQNVDGLSPRAGHPADQLKLLHGNLYDLKCFDKKCEFFEKDNFTDPIVPALAIPQIDDAGSVTSTPLIKGLDISSADHDLAPVPKEELPSCPRCGGLARPAVVWFGESLPSSVLNDVEAYFSQNEPVDLMLVIGTSAAVWPAASYIGIARGKGARVAVVNPDPQSGAGLGARDWFFCEDAAEILPKMLQPVM